MCKKRFDWDMVQAILYGISIACSFFGMIYGIFNNEFGWAMYHCLVFGVWIGVGINLINRKLRP